jgi:hypothetical protein
VLDRQFADLQCHGTVAVYRSGDGPREAYQWGED